MVASEQVREGEERWLNHLVFAALQSSPTFSGLK